MSSQLRSTPGCGPGVRIALWSFPQMALGLSGFEMIMNVVPRVSGGADNEADPAGRPRTEHAQADGGGRVDHGRVPGERGGGHDAARSAAELMPDGAAAHRALAYLAHGSPLADGGTAINPLFGACLRRPLRSVERVHSVPGRRERDAGPAKPAAPLPQPARHGSELGRQVGVILHVLNVIMLLVTVVFRASPSLQQWAYATSVLVLLTGAALAAAKDLRLKR